MASSTSFRPSEASESSPPARRIPAPGRRATVGALTVITLLLSGCGERADPAPTGTAGTTSTADAPAGPAAVDGRSPVGVGRQSAETIENSVTDAESVLEDLDREFQQDSAD